MSGPVSLSSLMPKWRSVDPALIAVSALLLAVVATGAVTSERFATTLNFLSVLEQSAALGFVSLGQTLVVLAGGIDLSVGGIVTGSAVLLAGLVNGHSNLMIPALIAVLLCGAAVGALNGVIAVRTGVHPLIVTLGMASILNGLVLLYTLQPAGKVPAWFQDFAFGRFLGLPIAGIVMLAAFSAVGFLLLKLPIGRSIYAVGGNYDAARLSGIRADRVTILVYAASGFLAALAGAYYVSRTGIGDPRVGEPIALASITPVVVGGTVLGGGRGGVTGTLVGVFLISLLNNLLNYMNVSTFLQWVIQGLIIIASVSVFVNRTKRL